MGLLDLVFPKTCLGCGLSAQAGREGKYLCEKCSFSLKPAKQICPTCERVGVDGMVHVKCKKKHGLDGLTCLWVYEGSVRKALLSLKYKFAFDIARELSQILIEALKSHDSYPIIRNFSVLVPIPTHPLRENWRGFNQSVEVGKLVARQMEWKFIPDLLLKRRITTPQTELKSDARKKNIKGVFSLNPNYQLLSTSYLLFDDVWTTGSTLKEAGKILKRSGAKTVWGLTIAR